VQIYRYKGTGGVRARITDFILSLCWYLQVAGKSQNTLRMKVLCEGSSLLTAATDASAPLSYENRPHVDENSGGPCEVEVKRYFYLKNTGPKNLVLDVEGMNGNAGTPVILWDQKFSGNHHPDMLLNQLWYEDEATSTIRTALNDFCLDIYGQCRHTVM